MKYLEKILMVAERVNMALALTILVAFAVNFVIRIF